MSVLLHLETSSLWLFVLARRNSTKILSGVSSKSSWVLYFFVKLSSLLSTRHNTLIPWPRNIIVTAKETERRPRYFNCPIDAFSNFNRHHQRSGLSPTNSFNRIPNTSNNLSLDSLCTIFSRSRGRNITHSWPALLLDVLARRNSLLLFGLHLIESKLNMTSKLRSNLDVGSSRRIPSSK